MKDLSRFTPLFVLFFLLSVIGFATHKISKKQEVDQQNIAKNFDVRFIKEKIVLNDFSLPDLFNENGSFSKKDLMGKKYVLVNLFASWCTTCRFEHEALLRLKDENIIDIYGIAWHDINENTKEYLAKSGNPFKKVAADNQGLFTKLIGIKAVPETLLLDNEGNIIWRYAGNIEETAIEEIKLFLREAQNY